MAKNLYLSRSCLSKEDILIFSSVFYDSPSSKKMKERTDARTLTWLLHLWMISETPNVPNLIVLRYRRSTLLPNSYRHTFFNGQASGQETGKKLYYR